MSYGECELEKYELMRIWVQVSWWKMSWEESEFVRKWVDNKVSCYKVSWWENELVINKLTRK